MHGFATIRLQAIRFKMIAMKITTLVENRPSLDDPALVAEWGLSQHVEIGGRRLLFDMGASDAFARNAARLGIDLGTVDAAIVSHHHYDHGGGLARFLELNDHAPIYLGESPDGDPIVKLLGFVKKSVGLDDALLARHAARFRVVRERTEVLPGVLVLPHVRGTNPRPAGNRQLFVRRDGHLEHDDFRHELTVALRDGKTLVVLTGCAHSGLLNMVEAAAAEFPGVPVEAVVGGFHLASLPPFRGASEREEVIADIGRRVLELGVGTTHTGHCTGAKAYGVLREAMGARVAEFRTGTRLEF